MPNKNDIVTIEITDITLEGMGVGKTAEGYVLFVQGSVPGDIIKVKILKVLASYGYAKIEEIITPSKDRIPVDCPVFSKCAPPSREMAWSTQSTSPISSVAAVSLSTHT